MLDHVVESKFGCFFGTELFYCIRPVFVLLCFTPVQQSGKDREKCTVATCCPLRAICTERGGHCYSIAAVTAGLQQGRTLNKHMPRPTIGTAECDAVVAKIATRSSWYNSGELLQQRRAMSSSSGLLQPDRLRGCAWSPWHPPRHYQVGIWRNVNCCCLCPWPVPLVAGSA